MGNVWCGKAAAVHGIRREQLETEGLPVAEVIIAVNAHALGRVVLSDSPAHDGKWLADLYRAGGFDRPPFALEDFGRYAWNMACRAGRRPDIAYCKAEAEAWAAFPVTHRAGQDARHNAEILRQLAGPDHIGRA
jgi:hypothetical protein